MAGPPNELERVARFEAFYNAHYTAISAYVRRRVSESDAGDAIAQVFAVAWRRFSQLPSPPRDRLWLLGVARNVVADSQRSWRRRTRLHARLLKEGQPLPSVVEELDSLHSRVLTAIAGLQPRDREVLKLILWDGLTHVEASEVLGCSVSAVESRLRRAQERVRQSLAITPAIGDPTKPSPVTARRLRSEP